LVGKVYKQRVDTIMETLKSKIREKNWSVKQREAGVSTENRPRSREKRRIQGVEPG